MIVVLVGVAAGSLFGYKGGVIMLNGKDYGFSNNLTQYDDFAPGALFDPDVMEPFSFSITDFDVDWLTEGQRAGMAREFVAHLDYTTEPGGEDKTVRPQGQPPAVHRRHRRLPHRPRLRAGDHDPRRRGQRRARAARRSSCRPTRQTFESFGVVKAPFAKPEPDRPRGRVLPDLRDGQGRRRQPHDAGVGLRRRARPARLAAASAPATSASTTAPARRSTSSTRPRPRS